MSPPSVKLPYFDAILEHVAREPDSELALSLGTRHVHWGYYADPDRADTSIAGLMAAAEALSARIAEVARVRDGQRILDAGCGFGGTTAHLNEHYSEIAVTGLNIDPRQVERARQLVVARPGNSVAFQAGDACAMPFPSGAFDAVLAVECIFHFPSRVRFFREARRVLVRGGRFALSDFIPDLASVPKLVPWMLKQEATVRAFYGPVNWLSPCTWGGYQALARLTGFRVVSMEDVTAETMPTYPVVLRALRELGHTTAIQATERVEEVSRNGWVRYGILGFEAV